MGKFNISTKGGELSDVAKLAHVDLPVEQEVTEEVTSPEPSAIDALLSGVTEGVEAGIAREQEVAEQQEREFVPDIITRRDDETRVDTYQRKSAEKEVAEQALSADGGLAARSRNMANKVTDGVVKPQGLGPHGNNVIKDTLSAVKVLDETGNIDKGFLQMASVITENTFADIAFNEGVDAKYDVDLLDQNQTPITKEAQETSAITKAQNNTQLGKQINREWHKYKNRIDGNPQGPIPEITNDQATALGDVAKELYFETNNVSEGERFMNRYQTPDGQVAFSFTKHGADLLKKGSHKRKRMFPKQHVRPTKTPTPGGNLVGDSKIYTKKVSSKIRKPIAGAEVINAAMRNLNTVANVVNPQRLKILLATAIPVLGGKVKPDSLFATMNNVGQDKFNEFAAKQANDSDFNAELEYDSLIDDLAQNVFGIARERKGANYLTYYMQGFTGRIAPQQTHFDPTSSKAVRFVTTNAVPAMATPGSRVERNLRQMYAMMLVKGADTALPAERDALLERNAGQLVKWGKKLKAAVDTISNDQVEAVAAAIEKGIPVTDPNFPQLPILQLNPQTDADLIQAIKDKGEDGLAFVDGVIDFTNYYEKKLNGQPHASYFNAYMDGKTNGLASNGIQMGSENVAYKTGVIRTQNKTLLDNDEDLRDQLKNTLLESIDQEGFDGSLDAYKNSLPIVASKVFSDRALNKSTTMTFGYGMELDSMKKVIEEHIDIQAQNDPELAEAINAIIGDGTVPKQKLVETLHTKYVGGLVKTLDPNALKSRAIMKSAAMLHALTNELFTIQSATGLELNFGGTESTGSIDSSSYELVSDGKRRKVTSHVYGEEATAAAGKRYTDEEGNINVEPGAIATGGSAVGPVQSLDAATVAMTASGKSWAKLKNASNGNPYLHTIYDAFKVDAMGYDVVLNEVNDNWLNVGMNWSYLEETRNAIESLRERWAEKNKGRSPNTVLDPNEWKMAGHLLKPVANSEGKIQPMNLRKVLGKTLDLPVDLDQKEFFLLRAKAAKKITDGMMKVGYDFKNPPEKPTLLHLNTFIKLFSDSVNVSPRLHGMIQHTNTEKAKLKAKIKRDGHKVYQYYSH